MNRFVVFALVVLVEGALTGPSVGAQAQSGSPSLDSYWTSTGKSYPAGARFSKPMPWAPGQYVVTGTTVNGTRTAVSKTLVVRQESGGWVVETSTFDPRIGERVTQMLINGFDQAFATGDVSGLEIMWIKKLEPDGTVSTMDASQLGPIQGLLKYSFQNFVSGLSGATDGGTVEVPAGTFSGTTTVTQSTTIMSRTITVQAWLYPGVPVSGRVKSMTTDGTTVVELLSFGFDGTPRIQG